MKHLKNNASTFWINGLKKTKSKYMPKKLVISEKPDWRAEYNKLIGICQRLESKLKITKAALETAKQALILNTLIDKSSNTETALTVVEKALSSVYPGHS